VLLSVHHGRGRRPNLVYRERDVYFCGERRQKTSNDDPRLHEATATTDTTVTLGRSTPRAGREAELSFGGGLYPEPLEHPAGRGGFPPGAGMEELSVTENHVAALAV
jgi:hypothetical protein